MSQALPVLSSRPSPLAHGHADWKSAHAALRKTEALWRSLLFEGLQSDGGAGLIELRRCPCCGSTLSRPVSAAEALLACQQAAELQARSLDALSMCLKSAGNAPSRRRPQ